MTHCSGISCLLLLLMIIGICTDLSSVAAANTPESACFYVSPRGSDRNEGTSQTRAFRSLERARDASRGSNVKAICLLGGVYLRSGPVVLDKSDAGEVWRAFDGEVPTLNGGGTAESAFHVTGANIQIRNLVIANFSRIGIFSQNAVGIVISGNTIENISSNGWNQGGVVAIGSPRGAMVLNNLIQNVSYAGIAIVNGEDDNIDNVTVSGNTLLRTCTAVSDCGAVIIDDRSHSSGNIRIGNNWIDSFGSMQSQSKAIYLDDLLSHVLVSGNVVTGSGTFVLQIHGGDHNVISGNIFDISDVSGLGLYQTESAPDRLSYGMRANVFKCNIIYDTEERIGRLWVVSKRTEDSLPMVLSNTYLVREPTLWRSLELLGDRPHLVHSEVMQIGEVVDRAKDMSVSADCGQVSFAMRHTSSQVRSLGY